MKVLIADDCQTTRELLESHVRSWGYEPLIVDDGEQALRVLRSAAGPRIALLDWSMPKLDGLEVCSAIRKWNDEAEYYTYVLMITGKEGADLDLCALESGVDDFIKKPIRPRALKLRLGVAHRIIELQQKVLSSNRQLAGSSHEDPVSGTLTPNAFLNRLAQEIDRAQRSQSAISLLSIEFDCPTELLFESDEDRNQTILRQLGDRLCYGTRSYDSIGRIADSSFLVILPDAEPGYAVGIADRVRVFASESFVFGEDEIDAAPISIGISSTASVGYDRSRLVQDAKAAMNVVLSSGGNQTAVRRPDGTLEILERFDLGDPHVMEEQA